MRLLGASLWPIRVVSQRRAENCFLRYGKGIPHHRMNPLIISDNQGILAY